MSSPATNEAAASGVVSMDIDDGKVALPTKMNADIGVVSNTNKMKNDDQLPWVEKYRPQRYVMQGITPWNTFVW